MGEQGPVMHRDFPRWYAAVAVGDNASRCNARWAAVHAIAQGADAPMMEALIRLAFATKQPPSSHAVNKLHDAYREADDTFDPRQAAREMQVLAAAILAVLFEGDGDIAAAAALNVAAASFAGARSTKLPMDLLGLAEGALERLSDANRTRPSLSSTLNAEVPKFDFEAAGTKAKEQSWEAVAQAFTLAANSTRTALKALVTRHVNATRAIDRFIQVQDEELQMLWWLTGRRSADLDCPFEAVPSNAQPLVFAKELADATACLPGPRSIKPLLSHAGLKERRKVTIAGALGAADADWLTAILDEADPSPVTQPIHFAIKRHLEAGGGATWVPNWGAVVGVEGDRQFSSLLLGVLFYRERLLALFV